MRFASIVFASVLALGLVACGRVAAASPRTITMGSSIFVGETTLTIKVGQSITFTDPSGSGGTHILVTGKNGQYQNELGAPTALNTTTGVTFNPGMTQRYVFTTVGMYTITCTIHQAMLATIIVTS